MLHESYHKYKPKTLHFPASVLKAAMVGGTMFSGCLNLILVQVISQSLEAISSDLAQFVHLYSKMNWIEFGSQMSRSV